MEQILNDYEEIYKFKRDNSASWNDEVSSLNNNFSIDENQMDFEVSNLFQNSTKFRSNENYFKIENDVSPNYEHYQEQEEMTQKFEFGSTKEECSTCICAKCQNDIRIEKDSCTRFWLKGNRLTICLSNRSSSNSLFGESNELKEWKPFELDFKIENSSEKNDVQIEDVQNELKSIEDWVNSLVLCDDKVQEPDIEVEPSKPKTEVKTCKSKMMEQNRNNESKAKLEEASAQIASYCGYKQYAFQYNWSQHQTFYNSLEGKVESTSTKTKGTSEKELNALSIRRSCFRALSSYFKNTFSKFNRAWQEKKRNKKKTKDMNELINIYIQQELGKETEDLSQESIQGLKDALIAILHSHRYKKEEEFTKDIDFSVIRDVLYSYTLDARDRFIKDPAYALLFHHFFVNGAYKFLNSTAQCKSRLYVFELEKELVSLHKEAIISLN